MYSKPELTKFGTFREITLHGRYGALDPQVVHGNGDGCTFDPTVRCAS